LSLIVLSGLWFLKQVDLLINFNFSWIGLLAHIIISLFWNCKYFFLHYCALAIAIFDSELREAPFTAEVAKSTRKSTKCWFLILDFFLTIFRTFINFKNVDCSLVGCTRHVLIWIIDCDIGDHCLNCSTSKLTKALLRFGVKQTNKSSLHWCSRKNWSILWQCQHCYLSVMHFKNLNCICLIFVKHYGLYVTDLFTGKGEYAILLTNGKRY